MTALKGSPYFSIDNITPLSAIPAGGKVHTIGVAGVAMAQLTVLLGELGYRVSGSDKDFYEPMGSLLRASRVRLCQGYDSRNITPDLDLVIIGNAVSYGHPEVMEVERLGLKYSIFPKLLGETVVGEKHSIVVAGTHGKSTTSAMGAFVLRELGIDPGYFIGGVVRGLPKSLEAGTGRFSIVEGDEYDSAFFAKVPKFTFYKPRTVILTSVEFDHADIYADFKAVEREFEKLLTMIPPDGDLLACGDDAGVRGLLQKYQRFEPRLITYGTREECTYRILRCEPQGLGQKIRATARGEEFEFNLRVPGEYNAKNALAVAAALSENDLPRGEVLRALAGFAGVKRRQEVRLEAPVTIIEDFAHHPTAVKETLSGVRRAFPDRTLWAVFEPRSNSSRKKVFQNDYISAFEGADRIVLCGVGLRPGESPEELLDVTELAQLVGKKALALPAAAAIASLLSQEVKPNDVILVMSNGSFGGLPDTLVKMFTTSAE